MKILRLLVPALLAASVVPVFVTPGAPAAQSVPTLVGIRAAHHPGFDRIVFDFDGGVPASRRVRYVDELIADGSGLPVRIAGRAILRVRFEPAQAHTEAGEVLVPRRRTFALPNIMTAVRSGDFESVTTYGIGLAKRTDFEVFTLHNPSRVVVDIRAAFGTVDRGVYFFDEDRFVANDEPFFVPRSRPVRASMRAVSMMDRLFAGVLPQERAGGLRFIRSEAKDFKMLGIENGIARVKLLGGCDSKGSTVTIAGEIIPTLKQLGRVDWVKIYGPGGKTGDPTGPSDSIPACLNP